MKYTAIAMEFMGIMIPGFAGYHYSLTPPAESVEGHFSSSGLAQLLFVFAVVLMLADGVLLVFGGKGYDVCQGTFWRRNRDPRKVLRK